MSKAIEDDVFSPTLPFAALRRPSLKSQGDRFIANRRSSDLDGAYLKLRASRSSRMSERGIEEKDVTDSPLGACANAMRRLSLSENIQCFSSPCGNNNTPGSTGKGSPFYGFDPTNYNTPSPRKKEFIVTTPQRILDIPYVRNDFYCTMLSWGKSNHIAIALDEELYIIDAATRRCSPLDMEVEGSEEEGKHITSVAWDPDGKFLAFGTDDGVVKIWEQKTRKINCVSRPNDICRHTGVVYDLEWDKTGQFLFAGKNCGCILQYDTQSDRISGLQHANQSCVISLKVSPDNKSLAAGCGQNTLNIWSLQERRVTTSIVAHNASVKAITWLPWTNHMIASGGGKGDGTVRLWNATNGKQVASVETHSQVCSIVASSETKDIITGHGVAHCDILTWRTPSLEKAGTLTFHENRVLALAFSPHEDVLVSASADERLVFWDWRRAVKTRRDVNLKRCMKSASVDLSPFGQSIR